MTVVNTASHNVQGVVVNTANHNVEELEYLLWGIGESLWASSLVLASVGVTLVEFRHHLWSCYTKNG